MPEGPRSVTTSPDIWPSWLAATEKADSKNWQQLEHSRAGSCRRWKARHPLVNKQGLAPLAGRMLMPRYLRAEAKSGWITQTEIYNTNEGLGG